MPMNESAPSNADDKLSHVSNELFESYIPVIVFLIVLAVVGISGNLATVVYFVKNRKNSSIEMFMLFLAGVDLTVSTLISFYIWQLVGNISYYTHRYWCKTAYFLFHWTVLLSVTIMCAIAIDRVRKVCFAFRKQISAKNAYWISIALLLLTSVLSARDFVTYDSLFVNITISNISVECRLCMNTKDKALEGVVKASHVFDIILVSAILVTLVTSYSAIVYSLCKQRKKMEFHAVVNRNESKTARNEPTRSASHQMTDEIPNKSNPTLRSVRSVTVPPQKISSSERTFSLMMLTATLSLVVCFVTYFIATLIKLKHAEVEFELSVGYRFAMSCVLANSVTNPVVYFVFNTKYRNFLMKVPFRCVRRETE